MADNSFLDYARTVTCEFRASHPVVRRIAETFDNADTNPALFEGWDVYSLNIDDDVATAHFTRQPAPIKVT
jgi:hypothetical protein